MADSQPIFVRLPRPAAERLDRVAQESGLSKREVITRLVTGDELVVGQHAFRPHPEPAVLTLAGAAELLETTAQAVAELAESGELPGRRVGGEWRFARAAILAWLGRCD